MDGPISDLGQGHCIQIIFDDNDHCVPVGAREMHTSSVDGKPCGGTVFFDDVGWTLLMVKPVTMTPSINCDYCNSHGVVELGKWIDTRSVQDYLEYDPKWPGVFVLLYNFLSS